MAYLIESMEKLVENPLITAWKQFLLGVLNLTPYVWCGLDRFLHHDSGEKDLLGKRRDHGGVCKTTARPWAWLLVARVSLAHPLQSDPVQPGNCLPCCRAAQCVHKFMGVLILHMETECVLCTLKDRAFLKIHGINTLHSAHSLVSRDWETDSSRLDRSETAERLHGSRECRGGEYSGSSEECDTPEMWAIGNRKRPQAAQIKEVQIKAWGFYSAHEGQAWKHCKKPRSSVHSRAHDLTGEKAVSDPWSVFYQTAQDNFWATRKNVNHWGKQQ